MAVCSVRKVIFIPIMGVPKKHPKYYTYLQNSYFPKEMELFKEEVRIWFAAHDPNLVPIYGLVSLDVEFYYNPAMQGSELRLHDLTANLLDAIQGIVYLDSKKIRSIQAKKIFTDKTGIQLAFQEV